MKKLLFLFTLSLSFLFAKEDYSEMSTQELIAIIGYVKQKDKQDFKAELEKRVSTMSSKEKEEYEKNKEKLK